MAFTNEGKEVRVVTETCKHRIRVNDGSFRPHYRACKKRATLDGYCGTHHPDKAKVRDEKRQAEWRRAADERQAQFRLQGAARDLLGALQALVACITETRGPNADAALHKARAAIARATGN